MIWVLLWLYIIGTFNEILFASSVDVDMSDWKNHLIIALWPVTVPAAMITAAYELMTDKGD